ncbi:glycerophosphodiester phosphodiesterase [Nocardia sp. CA-107356]|uniref:glycerophosphodiester phosphodiesterase n=1 Tax=Nocardia sp. CA-107356 TaxID=3239972 RepID=UPI003D8F5F58
MGRAPEYAFLDWPTPIAFSHRGDATHAPENTMLAFEAAVDLGYRYVETDVHATRDGLLVAFHNRSLDDVTDARGMIERLPWEYVARARVAGREPIPLLEDLLGTWPELRVNIDPKSDAAVEPLIDAIRRCGAIDRVCIGSFRERRQIRARAALGEQLCTSMGPVAAVRLSASSFGFPAGRPVAPCAQLPARPGGLAFVNARLIGTAHRRGIKVHAWTVDAEAEIHGLLDIGVDGIMTDRPTALRDVLAERGQWTPA